MYIDPLWVGVAVTILVEVALLVVVGLLNMKK